MEENRASMGLLTSSGGFHPRPATHDATNLDSNHALAFPFPRLVGKVELQSAFKSFTSSAGPLCHRSRDLFCLYLLVPWTDPVHICPLYRCACRCTGSCKASQSLSVEFRLCVARILIRPLQAASLDSEAPIHSTLERPA